MLAGLIVAAAPAAARGAEPRLGRPPHDAIRHTGRRWRSRPRPGDPGARGRRGRRAGGSRRLAAAPAHLRAPADRCPAHHPDSRGAGRGAHPAVAGAPPCGAADRRGAGGGGSDPGRGGRVLPDPRRGTRSTGGGSRRAAGRCRARAAGDARSRAGSCRRSSSVISPGRCARFWDGYPRLFGADPIGYARSCPGSRHRPAA